MKTDKVVVEASGVINEVVSGGGGGETNMDSLLDDFFADV